MSWRIGHYMRYIFEPGGIASYIRRVAAAQREMGHEVWFLDRVPKTMQTPEEVEYTRDDGELIARARELRLDMLHLHTVINPAAAGAVPMVRTVHTHAPYCPSQGRFLKRPGCACDRNYSLAGCLWGHMVNRCGSMRPAVISNFKTTWMEMASLPKVQVLAVSGFIKDQMLRAGYDGRRIEVIYLPEPGGDEAVGPPPREPVRFLFLGRMIPHKGVDWLLRAMTKVHRDVELDLAGTGNQEAEYRRLAERLNLGDRVKFHGWLAPTRVKQLLAAARALVFPSIWHEPGGTVAFEAMTNARAVIMSRVGGMPEVVEDGGNGLLVSPGDVEGLAAVMNRLAEDYERARRLGERGRELAREKYSMAAHMQRLHAVYEKVMAGYRTENAEAFAPM